MTASTAAPESDRRPHPPHPFNSAFRPAWWCRNPHLQTLWPYLLRPGPTPEYLRERIELDDGDFLDLDWAGTGSGAPIVLIVHGLCGDSGSHYVRGLVHHLLRGGLRAVVLHHRGCSGEPNRLPRSYHGGDDRDIDLVLRLIRDREPAAPLFAAGYSIGGSMLLNWLHRNNELLTAAGAVSVPLDLRAGAVRMKTGLSRLYQAHLVSEMKRRVLQKSKHVPLPLDTRELATVRSFPEFDDLVTAPLHGFRSAEHYYDICSPKQKLSDIKVRTLIIHAADDPLSTTSVIPAQTELSSSVEFELSRHGGHCGFVSGLWPHRASYWAEERISVYFRSFLPPATG